MHRLTWIRASDQFYFLIKFHFFNQFIGFLIFHASLTNSECKQLSVFSGFHTDFRQQTVFARVYTFSNNRICDTAHHQMHRSHAETAQLRILGLSNKFRRLCCLPGRLCVRNDLEVAMNVFPGQKLSSSS